MEHGNLWWGTLKKLTRSSGKGLCCVWRMSALHVDE
ncbi:unnamed protein product [Musa acuminata subsp. malaccensis]|uniref:(wild Malaysian banana) hypothetical protein n=1 Tax=Musa acuminata subsp. malaccensis TaxID=214687 RepID=A0A804KD51_MUSAM|nr:unnamed protein product [Musa acuminata subsp. malaccensis]